MGRLTKKGRLDERSGRDAKEANFVLAIMEVLFGLALFFVGLIFKFFFWIVKNFFKMIWGILKLFFNILTLGKFRKVQ